MFDNAYFTFNYLLYCSTYLLVHLILPSKTKLNYRELIQIVRNECSFIKISNVRLK